jgi:hypothetical protein
MVGAEQSTETLPPHHWTRVLAYGPLPPDQLVVETFTWYSDRGAATVCPDGGMPGLDKEPLLRTVQVQLMALTPLRLFQARLNQAWGSGT